MVNACILLNIISDMRTKIFAKSYQGKWILFLDLELYPALFYVKDVPSWNTIEFSLLLSWIIAMKNFFIFLFTLYGIHYQPLDGF